MNQRARTTNWGAGGFGSFRDGDIRRPSTKVGQSSIRPSDEQEFSCATEREHQEALCFKENIKRDFAQIDAFGVAHDPTLKPAKKEDYKWHEAASVHDWLADNPRLCAAYKRRGEQALLDFWEHREWDW